MGRESASWSWLRDGVMKTKPQFSLLERVENGLSAGMPDSHYLICGTSGWIELKAVVLPKRTSTAVLGDDHGLNQSQINWALKYSALCGRTWVFITADPHRWLISGAHARLMNEMTPDGLTHYARLSVQGKWKPKDWTALVQALSQ